jgi:hypothetical protein
MTIPAYSEVLQDPVLVAGRTRLSAEFEAHWRALPKSGLVPTRSAFRPQRAARFLRHLVLCDVKLEGEVGITMRVTGSEFESNIHRSARGEDYLQFLPELYRRGAIDSVRQIVARPCGLWQEMPLHYEAGFARNVEITVFPLKPDNGGFHQLLILTQFLGGPLMSPTGGDRVVMADTAHTFHYIDVGAGVPV